MLTPTRIGMARAFAASTTSTTFLGVADVAGIQSQLRDAGFDCGQRHLVIEMNVRNDRHRRTIDDRGQAGGVGRILHGDAHDLAALHREAVICSRSRPHRRYPSWSSTARRPDALRRSRCSLRRICRSCSAGRSACSCVAGVSRLHYSLSADDTDDVVERDQHMIAISAAKPANVPSLLSPGSTGCRECSSAMMNAARPPSSAGIGNRLKSPSANEIVAAR